MDWERAQNFSTKMVSDRYGQVSSMRVVFIITVICMLIGYVVLLFCTVWVVLHKDEFPNGMWQAMASIVGGIGALGGVKTWQTVVENKSPPPPLPGSEKE